MPRELSPAQRIAVEEVQRKRQKLAETKFDIEARIREEMRKEVEAIETAYAVAIRRAYQLEVSISAIGREGMNTTDRKTVKRWLNKTDALVAIIGQHDGIVGAFEWFDKDAGLVKVHYPAFPTTVTADDYPDVLEGVAKLVNGEWEVHLDPGTVETGTGVLPGWFTFELGRQVSDQDETSLRGQLNAWLEKK